MNDALLNNPVWSALTTEQASFARGGEIFKRFQPGVLSFAACQHPETDNPATLEPWLEENETFYLVGKLPEIPSKWHIINTLPCAQMVLTELNTDLKFSDLPIRRLGEKDSTEMFELINSIQPGYYFKNTHKLGSYFGIHLDGKLVAMAGERMKLAGFTELSAICTHPDYRGRGLAQQLIVALCEEHRQSGSTSFLHVATANTGAIKLYEHMGFRHRTEINFTKLRIGV
ncbi:GNAT family N-acetyltransferase [Chitinophaga silvatica]|uniref:GNAT family N-acetyltransferase n=1 Tax=Chitinophaga silvatica TaxID=2282649 RepID=A0A3E1Y3P8_9BACT|nr:GNAT family N-acetyltransferase [Chitinophaga silvatica]RFS19320.1 GNAT family N-acetyltransferase [Chitinophaga silvatica]